MSDEKIAVVAFEGWNDAGEAASGAIDHLIDQFQARLIYTFDPEPYYDFQVNRPFLRWDTQGNRVIEWRTTHIYEAKTESGRVFYIVRGIEPSMHWQTFSKEFLRQVNNLGISTVIALGSLLSDTPHTRPIPVTAVAMTESMAKLFDIEISEYEGPTGILGVIQQILSFNNIAGMSLWAAVPHYVSQPPSPKASMALLDALDEIINLPIPLGDFPNRTEIWQKQVNSLIENDEDMAEYVQKLELEGDSSDLSTTSGDEIAKEFERYLRRRENK